ncbi:DUF6153 family protein [Arthrobacter cupressi]
MRALAARLALLLAVASVLTGFLGMHAFSGHAAGHAAHAVSADSVDVHRGDVVESQDAAGCGCGTPCSGAPETHPSCVPLPGTVTLDAPAGSSLVLPAAPPVMHVRAVGNVAGHARSPSLHELCISRC